MASNSIEPRAYLCLTLALDHDLIDGAPAARFIKRLIQLIETSAGLHEQDRELGSGAVSR